MLHSWKWVTLTLATIAILSCHRPRYLTVEARSSGQNIDGACAEMVPFHTGLVPQTVPPPYSVSFDGDSYTPGSPVAVTIKTCTSAPFKGFMIQARRSPLSSDRNEKLGSFSPVAGTQQTCSGQGLIHTSSADKTSLTFNWTPPSVAQGPVQFRVTFVQSFSTVWPAVISPILKDSSSSSTPDPAANTPPTTLSSECSSSPSDDVTVPSGCGTDKGCIYDCSGAPCETVISWEDNGSSVLYTVTSKVSLATPYVAIGFSSDKTMGADSLTGCASTPSGSIVLFNAETTGQVPPTLFTDSAVTLKQSSLNNNILSCTFERPKAASADGKRFDITQDWHILFAKAKATVNGQTVSSLGYHMGNKFFTASKFSSNDKPDTEYNPDPITTLAPTGDLTVPSGCGSSLGCVSKCSGSSCETVISWEEKTTSVLYTISSTVPSSTAFVAIGFSSDDKMGGDSVTGCASSSSGDVVVFNAENTGRVKPTSISNDGVTLTQSKIENRVLSCTFERVKAASADGKRFDLSNKWIILFAKGGASVNGQTVSVNYHGANKFFTTAKFSSSDRPNFGASDLEYPKIKAHGSLMVAAWIFFASIGIIAARYYKPVWVDLMCSQKVWFQIHRLCMVLVFGTTVAGFILIFLEVEDWSELIEDHEHLEYHPHMGVVVTALTVLNPLMALFRPSPNTKNRPLFNWAHWFVGTVAHILAVITIFFGVQLQKAQVPDYMVYILAGYAGWQVLIALVLEVLQCYGKNQARQEVYEMVDMNGQKAGSEESAQTASTKKVILALHVFVITAVSSVLIGFIIVGEDDL